MKYVFHAQGHSNVSSTHRSTFEVTMDKDIGKTADCIIGVAAEKSMLDFTPEFKKAISSSQSIIIVKLTTENAEDEIKGRGHEDLTLDHPTDIVCRKSEYTCSRTLMIKADKAACDLNLDLIQDLKDGKNLKVEILVE